MWSSRLAFILAATGSAVGLGNVWRFPYVTAENGGGAFVLIYLACIAVIGLPIMIAEIMMGRHGRRSPINTLRIVAREAGGRSWWQLIGWAGLLAAVLILSFYSVIAGWTLHYVGSYIGGLFSAGPGITDPEATFGGLLASPWTLLGWHTLFMGLTFGVVAAGVEEGLERAVRYLMPAFFLLLVALVGYGMSTGYFGHAIAFLFTPDFGRLTWETVVQAMGQAFFTLSLGMGAIMAYGAYLPHNISAARTGTVVAASDTAVAIIAGLAIYPIMFANGQPLGESGPGLIFQALPLAFAGMGFAGEIYAILFFSLLVVAAWTSAISLMEPVTAYLVESHNRTRRQAAGIMAAATWLLGILSVLSSNLLSDVSVLGRGLLDLKDYIASNLLLPLGGLGVALFAGWAMKQHTTRAELSAISDRTYALWRFVVRFVAPILVAIIFVMKVGEL